MKKLTIAIDGPAGSGKSTTAKKVADALGYIYIDSGAMYRAVTLIAIEQGVIDKTEHIIELIEQIDLQLKYENGTTRVFTNGNEITDQIRSLRVNDNVSTVSAIAAVRHNLVERQRKMADQEGVVMEGRDIGTVVFPFADLKIFLTASIEERAKRRTEEMRQRGKIVPLEEVKANLQKRDEIDSNRANGPLKKAEDAVEVNTSNLTIDQQVEIILEKAKQLQEQSVN